MTKLFLAAGLLVLGGCVQDTNDAETTEDAEFSGADGSATDAGLVPDARSRDARMPTPDAEAVEGECGALTLAPGVEVVGELSGESLVRGSCGGSGPERLFSFTAPSAGAWYFSTVSPQTQIDTVLYVFGDCDLPERTELACNDDASGTQSSVRLDLMAGQTVFAMVDSFGQRAGTYAVVVDQVTEVAVGEACDGVGRTCGDGALCWPERNFQNGPQPTCEEVRPRGEGEVCDPFEDAIGPCEGELACVRQQGGNSAECTVVERVPFDAPCDPQAGDYAPCVAGALCFQTGDGEWTCEEVRERQIGESCDPFADRIGACVAGAGCLQLGGGRGECVEVRPGEEGEACDQQGDVRPCGDGLACRRLAGGQDGTFCVEIVVLPVGEICAEDESTGRCVDGSFCLQDGDEAPRCTEAGAECLEGWPVSVLMPNDAGFFAEGHTGEGAVNTTLCGNSNGANVYEFQAPAAGQWVFETTPSGDENTDTILSVRSACAIAQSRIECNDDGGMGQYSRVQIALEAEQVVYVLVGAFGQSVGPYWLRVVQAE